ncbi:alpha/beta hydrolase-fold protein [Microbulbifer sp. CAU 1566]|uniref:alpha/beta hydrolase n=1 Tax=Microbulbifer sp. CAU 1566 TaxID=2933269 RepID=UPI0020051DEC|nr:alpha/beta hydrolase-fold protein [Microbulbifer sp. CAU 1566]MCK7596497.1 alpha/beta hydrolase-fold protein [Microbulbifer sp. CAU 1566]
MKTIMTLLSLMLSLFCLPSLAAEPPIYGQSRTISSHILGDDKQLDIYLPAISALPDQKFPVLYLLHSQWDMLPAIATLDLIANTVPDFIVVGIESQGQELDVKAGDAEFAQFLEKELFPFIEREYPAASYRILSGHSHAGKFVMQQWLSNTLPVSQYFAFSPSLDDGDILHKVESFPRQALTNQKPLVLTMANEGEHMHAPYTRINAILSSTSKFRYASHHFPTETHRSTKHPSLKFALQAAFPEWAPTAEVKMSGAPGLKRHYDALSARHGLKAVPSVEMLQQITARHSVGSDEAERAKLQPLFDYAIHDLHVQPSRFVEIVDYLTDNGYAEASQRYLEALCETDAIHPRCGTVTLARKKY